MLRTRATEIYLPLLDQETVEFMLWLLTPTQIWLELVIPIFTNLLNTEPRFNNGTSSTSDTIESLEELSALSNSKEEEKKLTSQLQTITWLDHCICMLLRINSTQLIAEELQVFHWFYVTVLSIPNSQLIPNHQLPPLNPPNQNLYQLVLKDLLKSLMPLLISLQLLTSKLNRKTSRMQEIMVTDIG